MNFTRIALCLFALCLLSLANFAAPADEFHLIRTIEIGGDGGWDYVVVDSNARRLYVSHTSKVVVIDLESGKVVGEIPNTAGVHGIAIASDLGRGFTSNGRSSSVTIFDLKTLKILGEVKTGTNPDAITYDPTTKRIFAFNRARNEAPTVTVIEAATGKVISHVELGGRPEFAVVDGKGKIFVNLDDKNIIAEIDTRKLAITNRWKLAPGEEPTGLAIDLKGKRLFSVCGNKKMVVLSAVDGHVITSVPIGDGSDAANYDPELKLAFSSNGEGTLTIAGEKAGKFGVVATVPTQRGARTMTLDAKTHHIFLPAAEYGPTPAATKEVPRPRPAMIPGSFKILEFGK